MRIISMIPRAKNLLFASIFAIFLMSAAFGAHAAITPILSLSNLGNGQIQAAVTGDSSAAVSLYYYTQYPSTAQNVGTIGYTANNGYLSVALSYGQYNIPSGAYVYAMVDGAISQTAQWPNYTNNTNNNTYSYAGNSYSISFSQNNITIVQGQSMTVTLYGGSGSYYISQNSSLVSATISGNTLNISGVTAGSGSIVVCSNNSSCGTLNVTVTATSYGYSYPTTYPTSYQTSYPTSYSTPYSSTYPAYPTYPPISLIQGSVSLNAGQQESLNISGSGQGYYVYSNSNSYAVTANVSGSTLSINGAEPGISSIMICESVGASCTTLYVTVNAIPTFIYSYAPTYTYSASAYYSQPSYYSQPQPIYYSQPVVQRIAQPAYNFFQPVMQLSSYAYPRNW